MYVKLGTAKRTHRHLSAQTTLHLLLIVRQTSGRVNMQKGEKPLRASLNPTRNSSPEREMAGSSGDHLTEAKRAAGLAEPKMWAVYVLRLNCDEQGNPKFYVGMTNNLWQRLHNHARGNKRSSNWVLKWGYAKVVEKYLL